MAGRQMEGRRRAGKERRRRRICFLLRKISRLKILINLIILEFKKLLRIKIKYIFDDIV
jgi:hypothetical protein